MKRLSDIGDICGNYQRRLFQGAGLERRVERVATLLFSAPVGTVSVRPAYIGGRATSR